jgi:hypothetical protein
MRQFGRGERDRDIIARMAAAGAALRVGADHIVVEIEDADQRAVGEHRARRAHAIWMAEHRALRFAAECVERRQHRTRAVIIQRGKTAAERIEQQELRPLDGALRKILGAQCREPCGKPLDGAFVWTWQSFAFAPTRSDGSSPNGFSSVYIAKRAGGNRARGRREKGANSLWMHRPMIRI